ncbi:hypothetical protein J7E49_20200 [Variovorax paradoxus]|nr:hypothetical protein [Variovorax paradoxus]
MRTERVLYRVHLSADALMVCEVHAQRGSRRVARKARFAFAAGERPAAMQALGEWMGVAPQRRPRETQQWVLGTSDVRYLLLPWTPDLADQALRSAFAAALFEQQFKQDPGLYALRFARPVYGCALLAAFVPQSLLAELDAHAVASGVRLVSTAPSLATVWDRFGAVLQRETGEVRVMEGDRQIIVRHVRGRMNEVLLRPFDAAGDEALPSSHATEAGFRFFAAVPLSHASAGAALPLADGDGFLATQDAAYAFALCGVF